MTTSEKLYALLAVFANCERIDDTGGPNTLSLAEIQRLGTEGLNLMDDAIAAAKQRKAPQS